MTGHEHGEEDGEPHIDLECLSIDDRGRHPYALEKLPPLGWAGYRLLRPFERAGDDPDQGSTTILPRT
jgi:hypothetical protein